MSKTPQQRYAESIAYLKKIDSPLGAEVDRMLGPKVMTVGTEISLARSGFWNPLAGDKHDAMRALLLCYIAYFRTPHCKMDWASTQMLDQIKSKFVNKSKSDIDTEIRYFIQDPARTPQALAHAAETHNLVSGVPDYLNRTRKDKELGANPVCYNGVFLWLFVSGFVSKRWLAKEANELDANSANRILGDGQVVGQDRWNSIPRGYIWNIHRTGDKTTCHWGVSLGNDRAAACNNTDESPTMKLAYETGDTKFGIFKFSEICTLLERHSKYGYSPGGAASGNITVRAFDPTTITTYY